jgi:hypothetical protein
MSARARWWHQLQASKSEVRLAVDLYNRSTQERSLEAFVVHMIIAWTKLIQARYERDGEDIYVRGHRGHRNWRQPTRDGDFVTKPLHQLIEEQFGREGPVTKNVEFFIGLRNRIEHRYDRDTGALVYGRVQALVLNYENTLVDWFGEDEGLAEELRFPIFLSTITSDAVEALKEVRERLPRRILDYVQDFDASLAPEVAGDQRYEFRVYLIPQTSSKTEADAAMTFVRLEELDDEQRAQVEQMRTIIRDKKVPVEDLGHLRATQVAERVEGELGMRFGVWNHTQCWKHYDVRPPHGSDHPERTKGDFCRYNEAFHEYVYTEAWVKFLVRKLGDADEFEEVIGHRPIFA